MPSHALHTQGLLKNVAIEVIYENNPTFADENVSAIVRFKHLALKSEEEEEEDDKEPPIVGSGAIEDYNDTGSEWFGRRFSIQLSNTARSLFQEESNKGQPTPRDDFHSPVELFSGYIQLSGVFTFNESVVNQERFDQSHKNSSVSGKIGGLQGLEVTKTQNGGMFGYISSGLGNFFNGDIQSIAKSADEKGGNNPFASTRNLVPFFSTTQTLLFSSISLKPGEIKNFYFNCKLPKYLPPSYGGNSIKINYRMIVGSSVDSKSNGYLKPFVLNFPLRISSFFNKFGYQPVFNLENFILLQSESSFSEPIEDRTSFKQLKKLVDSKLFINRLTLADKRKIFINRIKDLQKEECDNTNTINNFQSTKVKESISQFNLSVLNSQTDTGEQEDDSTRVQQIDGFRYERQINKFQNQWVLNRDGKFVSSVRLSKPFYKVGDLIKLDCDFKAPAGTESKKILGIMITLENIEIINSSYSVSDAIQEKDSDTTTVIHYRESFSVFDSSEFSASIPIPINATSQFKTNLFESKWSLVFKFILANENELKFQAHSDPSGTLVFAKDSLGGQEFNCRFPLYMIPSDQEFGGIALA